VYFVELSADQDERIRRNVLPERLTMKRRTAESGRPEWIRRVDSEHRLNTDDAHSFPLAAPYVRLDTTRLHPAAAAEIIGETFGFRRVPSTLVGP
jgi:hypothetical protein